MLHIKTLPIVIQNVNYVIEDRQFYTDFMKKVF